MELELKCFDCSFGVEQAGHIPVNNLMKYEASILIGQLA